MPEPEIEIELEPEPVEVVAKYSSYELTLVAQAIAGEAGICSREEQKLVAGCICNRADLRNQTIEEVVTAPRQFHGWNADIDITEEHLAVAEEVLMAWAAGEPAPVYPPYATNSNYEYFYGDGVHNWFREEW